MAWYKTGTVSVTNASTSVTGSGTNFVSGAQVGEAFQGPDGELYEITAISSATSLTITPAYGGSTASGQSYAIVPTQSLVADLASDVADLISDYQTVVDEAGAGKFGDGSAASPSIKFTQDQDTGFFRDTANEIAISAGGSKIGSFTANGLEFLDNEKFTVGTGSDFSIYHNGNNTFLEESGTGALVIRSNALNIQNAAGTETLAQFIEDGAVTLRYDNEIKLQTTTNGVNFTAETVGITGTTGSTKLQITSTDDGAGDGPLLQLFRDSSTPAASDNIARIDFLGENSIGGQIAYARIDTFIQDPTDGSEQGRMRFLIESEGTQRSFLEMDASAGGAGGRTWINSGQEDIDFRVSGDTEANLFYVDASTDRIGVGTGTPSSVFHVQDSKPSADLVYFNQTTTVGADVLRLNTAGTGSGTKILDVQSNSDTKFVVRGDGNTGIGTDAPTSNLSIDAGSATGTHLDITTTGSGHNFDMVDGAATARIRNVDGALRIGADNNNETADSYVRFDVDGTEKMRIDSSGLVGIGVTNPTYRLTISQSATNLYAQSIFAADNTAATRFMIGFKKADGTTVGSITTNNSNSTSYNTSSDYRLKEDIQPITGASERVLALNPVNFAWISGGSRVDGFIAHEAQEVVPEAVTGAKDAMRDEEYEVTPAVLDDEGDVVTEAVMGTREVPEYQGIDQSKLVPLLTAALQEALAKIDELETRLDALESA